MTDAFNLLISGQYLQAITTVFTSQSGDAFFYFMILSGVCLLTYLVTQNIGMAIMIFTLVLGGVVLSHLTQFHERFGALPGPFESAVALIVLVGAAYLFMSMLRR